MCSEIRSIFDNEDKFLITIYRFDIAASNNYFTVHIYLYRDNVDLLYLAIQITNTIENKLLRAHFIIVAFKWTEKFCDIH